MNLDDESDEFIHQKFNRSGGKRAYHGWQSDIYVELKQKCSVNVRPTAVAMPDNANNYILDIGHDAWFHIAMRLDPEDIQTFALVCKQTAKLVNSRVFWRNMYKRHCLGVKGWNLELPNRLQLDQIRTCDTKVLRFHVIEALFYCYPPLKLRMNSGYSLDWLLQRTFVTCTQQQYQCLWIVCYKFSNQRSSLNSDIQMLDEGQDVDSSNVLSDWEVLADDNILSRKALTTATQQEGVILLIVLCRQFIPLPLQLLYNQQQSRFRLKATRELLCTDMRAKNLELDFVEDSSNSQLSVTVKYPCIDKFKVLPWWHPDFKRFLK